VALSLKANARIREELGVAGVEFLFFGIGAIDRLLPHVETFSWTVREAFTPTSTEAKYSDSNRRELRLVLRLDLGSSAWDLMGSLRRRKHPTGVGAISRTIDEQELRITGQVLGLVGKIVGPLSSAGTESLAALKPTFDERVVAQYLAERHGLALNLGTWFSEFRLLAEQTYENKAMTFGCVLDPSSKTKCPTDAAFPSDYLARKKYRALSDGYRTAYKISKHGAVDSFFELSRKAQKGVVFFPEWCEGLAAACKKKRLGLALTRQGDIVVLYNSQLRFTYRFGKWQYWNHSHIVDLIRNAARVQKVKVTLVSGVVRAIYRGALDTSFRRTGGLFVLLRRATDIHKLVKDGEAIDDPSRVAVDRAFDDALGGSKVQDMSRVALSDLVSLDGAAVISNSGKILAYGAILEPTKKGKTSGSEGSRTKAAIGASKFGLAVKVSSDGDITVYLDGKKLIVV